MHHAGRCGDLLPGQRRAGHGSEGPTLFAGLRLEPFFIDLPGVKATEKLRRLAFKAKGQQCHSRVTKCPDHRGRSRGHHGVWRRERAALRRRRRNVTAGQVPIRLERIGRPEIKNASCRKGVRPGEPRPRDSGFVQPGRPVRLARPTLGAYRARLNANLAFFDGLDDKTDWPLDEQGDHPLTELLFADFQVMDVPRPYAEDGYASRSSGLCSKGRPHATCGGRSLNDDVQDTLATLLRRVATARDPRWRRPGDRARLPELPLPG